MTTADDNIARLQRLVDNYPAALSTALDVVSDEKTPAPARLVLVGALNYALDLLDIFPDQYKGMGVADDSLLLHIAAQQAVKDGAHQPELHQLAAVDSDLTALLGDLVAPLEKYVTSLSERTVRGRTAKQIVVDKDLFAMFAGDVRRHLAAYQAGGPQQIDTSVGAEWLVGEMHRMIRHELARAKIV
jgi:uncharacterized membrane protein YkvA (DUF1232 family)